MSTNKQATEQAINASIVPLTEVEKKLNSNLLIAAKEGRLKDLSTLMACEGVDINTRDARGNTPLILATLHGRNEIVLALLASKAIQLDAVNSKQRTALHYAAKKGYFIIASLLIQKGASLSLDKEGITPFELVDFSVERAKLESNHPFNNPENHLKMLQSLRCCFVPEILSKFAETIKLQYLHIYPFDTLLIKDRELLLFLIEKEVAEDSAIRNLFSRFEKEIKLTEADVRHLGISRQDIEHFIVQMQITLIEKFYLEERIIYPSTEEWDPIVDLDLPPLATELVWSFSARREESKDHKEKEKPPASPQGKEEENERSVKCQNG